MRRVHALVLVAAWASSAANAQTTRVFRAGASDISIDSFDTRPWDPAATYDIAELWAHGYAWNRVPTFPPGADLWETWGNYRLTCRRVGGHWRLDGFRYYSKLTRGNDAVRTHTEEA